MKEPIDAIAHLRHELRTPVNHILGFTEILIEEAIERNLQSFVPALQNLRDGGHQLLASIQQALGDRHGEINQAILSDLSASLRVKASTYLDQAEDLRAQLIKEHQHALHDVGAISDALRNLLHLTEHAPASAGSTATPARDGAPAQTANPARPRGRIVIADDDRGNRDILKRRLVSDGHETFEAANGIEVLAILESTPCDLVLLDIMMPELDGFQTLARMKRDSRLRDIPVIMISALDDLTGVAQCIEMGAEDYLPKPFNRALLHARLGASLEKKWLRDRDVLQTEELKKANTQLEAARAKLALQASQDVVTGLANRRSVDTHIDNRVREAAPFSVFYIDLNGFKQVNDTYGHQAGDDLLRQVGIRLRLAFRVTDVVGRWGGDEFVGIVAGTFGSAQADAARISNCFKDPFTIESGSEQVSVRVGAAIGIAVWQPGDNIADVLKRADTAMYRKKQEKRKPSSRQLTGAGRR